MFSIVDRNKQCEIKVCFSGNLCSQLYDLACICRLSKHPRCPHRCLRPILLHFMKNGLGKCLKSCFPAHSSLYLFCCLLLRQQRPLAVFSPTAVTELDPVPFSANSWKHNIHMGKCAGHAVHNNTFRHRASGILPTAVFHEQVLILSPNSKLV